jgi:hypothetical protein
MTKFRSMGERAGGVLLISTLLFACSDEGEDDTSTSSGAGGAGAATTSSGEGGSTVATTSSGSGGAGGDNTGGGAGTGGAGPVNCLFAGATVEHFSIATDDLCAVAVIQAPALELAPYGASPTWGRHQGPLTFVGDATGLTITRWAVNGDALGASTKDVSVPSLPADAFWGAQIVDASQGGNDLAIASWTGSDFFTQGALVVTGASSTGVSVTATGVFGLGAVDGAIVYTGLSAAGGPTNGEAGVYRAALAPSGNALASSAKLEAFGLATGPVAVDDDGNAFALMTDYVAGTQEIRFYAASALQAGGAATGATLVTLDGYGDAMAALGPRGASPGIVLLQPNATSGAHLDVVGRRYTTAGSDLGVVGALEPMLALTTPDTNLTLMSDDAGRLWVGAAKSGGGAVFYVLDRP